MGPALGSGPMAKRDLPVNASHGKGAASCVKFLAIADPPAKTSVDKPPASGAATPFSPRSPTPNAASSASGGPEKRWGNRSEEHTSELQSLMRISLAVLCLKQKKNTS